MGFKNALCLAPQPDWGGTYPPWAHQCHRRKAHQAPHRIKFRDGGIREWNPGDRETKLTTKPKALPES